MPLESGVWGNAQLIERVESTAVRAGVACENSDNFFWQCPILYLLSQHDLQSWDVVFNQITCESLSFFYSFIEAGWGELGRGEGTRMSSFGMSVFCEMRIRQDWANRSWQRQPPIVLGCKRTSRLFHSRLIRETVRVVMWCWETGARSGAVERKVDQAWVYTARVSGTGAVMLSDGGDNRLLSNHISLQAMLN